jgi:hypothetical protein
MTTSNGHAAKYRSPGIGGDDLVERMKRSYAEQFQQRGRTGPDPERYSKVEDRVRSIAKGGAWQPYAEIAGVTIAPPAATRYAQPEAITPPAPQLSADVLRRIDQRIDYNQKTGRHQTFATIKHDILAGR